MSEKNKEVVQRLMDAHVRQDVARVREILSPRLRWHSGGAPGELGRDEYLGGMEEGARAFSDLSITVDGVIAERDDVAVRARVRGRHTGAFQDIAPTGRAFEFASFWFYRVVDGKIVEAFNLDEDVVAKLRAE